jgi:glutathione S-transferase
MNYVDLVALAAILQLLVFGVFVGLARSRYGVKAPATTGHPMFERAYRVQMNTTELIVAFLPSLYIAGKYWPGGVVAACGAVYLIGRQIYRHSYVADPDKRSLGFVLTAFPIFALLALGLVGALR